MMHTLGFFHEQSRWDRKDYIKVLNDSIANYDNFKQYNLSYTDDLNTPYDYGSVLHYAQDQGVK